MEVAGGEAGFVGIAGRAGFMDSGEGVDALAVGGIAGAGGAGELAIGEDDEVVAGAVALVLGAGGTAGVGFVSAVTEFFETGGVEHGRRRKT
ncbi:hypothetical protein llg_12710 [Luteolibacter sp. LG18]|nr:hypothetical protein llg_12710 [Luteolibacter sp. LG18]